MSDQPDNIETRLRRLSSPELPGNLKDRVLAAASLTPAVTWRDRVWFSTRWRIAVAALVLALLSADRWVGPPRPAGPPDTDAAAAAELQALEAVGSEVGVPAETMRRLVERSGIASRPARLSIDEALGALDPPR
jgi:hypothetical protein